MAKSLQDQLLNSGIINKKQANQAKAEKHQQQKQQNKQGKKARSVEDEAKQRVREVAAEKLKKDRELNRQRAAMAEAKAVKVQIKQLIEMNCVAKEHGDIAFNFTDNNKVKKIYVTARIQELLSRGLLAVASLGDNEKTYELVPVGVANKIKQRDAQYIVFLADKKQTDVDEDDPYAAYKIPDDLMW